MKAVLATAPGGPEVLVARTVPDPEPDPGALVVRLAAAGVNFIDTYLRSGVYPAPFPHVPGGEGSGVVESVGSDVAGFSPGDRVAWEGVPGSYAERVVVPASRAVPVPDGVALETSAALMLQGLTAHYLVTSTYRVEPGDDVLLTGGAGGVGLLATQLATARRARVITTVGGGDKEELSRAAGATDVIRYRELEDLSTDLPRAVRDLTGGDGVAVAYDGVGKDTFDASLASLRRRGTLVLFGGASGQVPPFDIQRLNRAGSLFLTRPTLADYVATREELLGRCDELFAAVLDGTLDVRVGATFALADAAEAHRALEGRGTTGKVLLVP